MRTEWTATNASASASFQSILEDSIARRLLLIACINAAPVAVSSTLFLFFVESRLSAPGLEGPLLLLYFLSAAFSVPIWGKFAERLGTKNTLMGSMVLAIVCFAFAIILGAGDWVAFAFVCAASGAALGADLTLLPVMFSKRMGEISPNATEGFGLWSFVSKFTLAFAAALLLPALQLSGFESGSVDNSEQALIVLTLMYAAMPCVLKVVALILLACTAINEE